MTEEPTLNMLLLDDEIKAKIGKAAHKIINIIEEGLDNIAEKAALLRFLIESFEDNNNCKILIRRSKIIK